MATVRAQHAASLQPDGSVLVAHGVNRTGFVTTTERFAPDEDTWSSLSSSGSQGNVSFAVLLPTGQTLVLTDGSAAVRRYDPASSTWSDAGTMSASRSLPSATLLTDGRVLVAGGSNLSSADIYDPASNTWSAAASMSSVRRAHVATLLRDGRVLVASGFNTDGEVASAELYDATTNTWSLAAPPLVPRHYAALSLLPDGRALLAGGFTVSGVTTHAELYDPSANTWTATGSLTHPRNSYHMATLLNSGLVLMTGGSDSARNTQVVAELYDPATGTWSTTDSLATGRENHTSTLLTDGSVLITGGYSSNPSLTFYASVERYIPGTPAGVVPTLGSLPLLQAAQSALHISGSGFTGSGASTPQFRLRRLDNGALYPLALQSYADSTAVTNPLPALPAGLYFLQATVDGVPARSQLIQFTDGAGTPAASAGSPGSGQATVNWAAPTETGSNPPVSYSVVSTPASAGCTAIAPQTSCVVSGLTLDVPYTFTVQANHANGDGPISATSAPITLRAAAEIPPSVPVPTLATLPMLTLSLLMAAAGLRRSRSGKA